MRLVLHVTLTEKGERIGRKEKMEGDWGDWIGGRLPVPHFSPTFFLPYAPPGFLHVTFHKSSIAPNHTMCAQVPPSYFKAKCRKL